MAKNMIKASFLSVLVSTAAAIGFNAATPSTAMAQRYKSVPATAAAPAQELQQNMPVYNETFRAKHVAIDFRSSGLGSLIIDAQGDAGAKNTGSKNYLTELDIHAEVNDIAAPQSSTEGNNVIVFTKIDYVDKNAFNSNNYAAEVEFFIAPLSYVRKRATETNKTAFTNRPYIDISQVDLDQDTVPPSFYGISVLKFKGRVEQLKLSSDVFPAKELQMNATNLVNRSQEGFIISNFRANRFVYLAPNTTQIFPEDMQLSPKGF